MLSKDEIEQAIRGAISAGVRVGRVEIRRSSVVVHSAQEAVAHAQALEAVQAGVDLSFGDDAYSRRRARVSAKAS